MDVGIPIKVDARAELEIPPGTVHPRGFQLNSDPAT